MNEEINSINITKEFNASIYTSYFGKYLNKYNKTTLDNIDCILKLYNENKCFEVPFFIDNLAWGTGKIYYPFTTLLIKVLSNDIGRTSIQFHPLKTECWFALSEKTTYFDGNNWNELKKYSGIRIPSRTIHSLEKGSYVLEIQDNVVFDNKEAMRIKDFLGRKIDNIEDYLKYLIPTKRETISQLTTKNYLRIDKNCDYLIFSFEDKIVIKYDNDKEYSIEKNILYFAKKGFEVLNNDDNVVYIKCEYFETKNNH